MDYKKVIKNQELRFKILNLLRLVPDLLMIKIQYRIKLKRKLNLKSPSRYSEKLQWYKLNYRTDLMTKCADKYEVRQYIKDKGLESILNKLYGVYDRSQDIKLEDLPDKFVLKTTNGSGTNFFCTDKKSFDLEKVNKSTNKWLKRNIYAAGREWAYKNIEPQIIVEEFLEDQNNSYEGINDYKFLCFDGKVEFIILDVDRQKNHKRNIYDKDWNYLEIETDHVNLEEKISKPKGLEQMIEIANILAEDFPCVRVDLYWVNNRVYFGELTFYPWTGYIQFKPDEFDFELGEKFKLPKK